MFQRKKSDKELHNTDETEEDEEITTHKKWYIYPKERQQIIDELTLLPKTYWRINVNIKKYKFKVSIVMEYQKDNKKNQTSRFGTRNWVEINDESRGKYTIDTEFKTTMLRANLYDYGDMHTQREL